MFLRANHATRFPNCVPHDFSFWFPVGPYQGLNRGKAKAEEFFQSVSKIFPDGLELTLERCTSNDTTVVFEVHLLH